MKRFRRWLIPLSIVAPFAAHAGTIAHRDVDALAARGIAFARAHPLALQQGLLLAIGGGAPDLLLREVELCVDDAPCLRYEYNVDEGQALAAGGLHLLELGDLGARRLRADAIAVDPHAPPYAARTRAKLDLRLQPSTDALELQFAAGTLAHEARLTATPRSADALRPRAARYLLADDRPFEAAAMFSQAPAPVGTSIDGFVSRYNAAIATIGGATPASGFEQLRSLAGDDHADPWLRDRAGMTLGEQLLAARRNAEAAQAFRAVRSPGPFANRALLELGWTFLLPTGDAASSLRPASYALPSSADQVAQLRRQTPFRYLTAVAGGARADDLRAALVPWMELIGRDPFDPAVQEGMLAVPYALAHLGAQEQSIEYAQRAVSQLQAAHTMLEQAAAQIDPALVALLDAHFDDAREGWHQQLGALAPQKRWWLGDAPEPSYYLGVLLADPRFVEALADLRTLHQLRAFLDRTGDAADASLRAEVDRSLESLRAQLRALATAALTARSRATAHALAEAHLWIARLRDRSPQQVTSR
ncbi:MAG TPA: hypothetical protein VFB36_03350 [Nevskiaceae bacterium]|nr:hypothetical protein [Nevskiaceae bacterium]